MLVSRSDGEILFAAFKKLERVRLVLKQLLIINNRIALSELQVI